MRSECPAWITSRRGAWQMSLGNESEPTRQDGAPTPPATPSQPPYSTQPNQFPAWQPISGNDYPSTPPYAPQTPPYAPQTSPVPPQPGAGGHWAPPPSGPRPPAPPVPP